MEEFSDKTEEVINLYTAFKRIEWGVRSLATKEYSGDKQVSLRVSLALLRQKLPFPEIQPILDISFPAEEENERMTFAAIRAELAAIERKRPFIPSILDELDRLLDA